MTNLPQLLKDTIDVNMAMGVTGCLGAGGYVPYARNRGYNHIKTLDWTSSAGDWSFLISSDDSEWRILWQTNNWPKPGFSYSISDTVFYGTVEEVYKELETAWKGTAIE